MVTVTFYHVPQIAFMPLVPEFIIAIFHLGNFPFVKGFHLHQNAHLITKFQLLRRWWIVAGTDGIHPYLFHDLELAFRGTVVYRATQWTEIVMQTNAFEFHRMSVQ